MRAPRVVLNSTGGIVDQGDGIAADPIDASHGL